MAEFVQTMNDWRRMCDTIQSENQKTSSGFCMGCPLQELCVIDTSIKDSTDREFDVIGERIQSWAAEHPEPVYPTWIEWFREIGVVPSEQIGFHIWLHDHIRADIAEKLGLQPKEG